MKPASRPQYYRIKRIVDMAREGSEGGYLPNRGDFRRELEVSPRTLARDLDFLRDEERAPIEYDAKAHGYRLTDEGYRLPPVRVSRKEAFGFALARRLLAAFEGTPLHLEMRTVLGKIAESLEGEISVEPEWLSEQVSVLAEDRVEIDPGIWARVVGLLERREVFRTDYQTFTGQISGYELHPSVCWPTTGTGTSWRTTRPRTAWKPSPCRVFVASRGRARPSSGPRASIPAAMPGRPSASRAARSP